MLASRSFRRRIGTCVCSNFTPSEYSAGSLSDVTSTTHANDGDNELRTAIQSSKGSSAIDDFLNCGSARKPVNCAYTTIWSALGTLYSNGSNGAKRIQIRQSSYEQNLADCASQPVADCSIDDVDLADNYVSGPSAADDSRCCYRTFTGSTGNLRASAAGFKRSHTASRARGRVAQGGGGIASA